MIEYLQQNAKLKEVALANLGPMDKITYQEAKAKAADIAREHGIRAGKLIIDLEFKPGKSPIGIPESPYPIAESDWDAYLRDVPVYLTRMPNVYVVDADKYTAPI